MKPELRRVGATQSPIVVIDDFSGDVAAIIAMAESLAPFPHVRSGYYPGLRRMIERTDTEADAYVERTCEVAGQFIAGAFDFDSFDLIEASFSIVSTEPEDLRPAQRAPHFDSPDPAHLALLHYLRVPAASGTAFYRQRATEIERVTDANVDEFVAVATRSAAALPHGAGYIQGSDPFYEQIGVVEAVPDRLVIYQGSLLHSGIIPDGVPLSADPREGRLTANLFVRGQ